MCFFCRMKARLLMPTSRSLPVRSAGGPLMYSWLGDGPGQRNRRPDCSPFEYRSVQRCIGLAYKPEEGRVEMQRLMYSEQLYRPWYAKHVLDAYHFC
jgi:hypothetical protein